MSHRFVMSIDEFFSGKIVWTKHNITIIFICNRGVV